MNTLLAAAAATLLALVLGRTVRRRLGFLVEVESVSMAPTLAPGQRLMARRPDPAGTFRRGDVVVVASAEVRRPIIKRVVGLPGEHLEVDADGHVRVDGRDLDEPYVVHRGGLARSFDVPPGHLLLLGDNRAASSDARTWRQPFVPVSAVLGRAPRPRRSGPAAGPGPGSPRRDLDPTGRSRPAATPRVGG